MNHGNDAHPQNRQERLKWILANEEEVEKYAESDLNASIYAKALLSLARSEDSTGGLGGSFGRVTMGSLNASNYSDAEIAAMYRAVRSGIQDWE